MKTIAGRKVRADAKLERLSAEQRDRLHGWFEESCTYAEVMRRVQQEFGISVGKSAVSVYWRRHILPQQQEDAAESVAAFAALPAGDFDEATIRLARTMAWEVLARSHPDIDRAAKLLDIVRKAEKQALAVERLALAERRVALREARVSQGSGEAGELAGQRRSVPAEKRSGARCEAGSEAPVLLAPREENSPRCAGYSGLIRSDADGGRGEGVEVTATAQSCEGLSQGAEGASIRFCQDFDEVAASEPPIEVVAADSAPAVGAGGDAAFAEVMRRLDGWEERLEQMDENEDGLGRLAALANEVYAEFVRFKEQHGLGGAGYPQSVANVSARHPSPTAQLGPILPGVPDGGLAPL